MLDKENNNTTKNGIKQSVTNVKVGNISDLGGVAIVGSHICVEENINVTTVIQEIKRLNENLCNHM